MEQSSKIVDNLCLSQPSMPDWDKFQVKLQKIKADRHPTQITRRHFKIDARYGDVYFTLREAQCMAQIMRGRTVKSTALFLGLSPRTVEYYLKNMKAKMKCRTKSELMQLIADTEFMTTIGRF